jgi:hypothetical protein
MAVELSDQELAAQLGGQDAGAAAPEQGEPALRDTPPRPRPSANAQGKKRARQRAKRAGTSAQGPGRPAQNRKARTAELEKGLARLLVAPAVPVIALPLELESKQFLSTHFMQAGPAVAHQLAVASEQSPELRELLERWTEGSVQATLVLCALAYVAPPAMWMLGMRGPAQLVSGVMSMDEAQLEALAEQAQARAEAEAAAAAQGGGMMAPDASAPSSEQPGASSPPLAAEPAAEQ